MMIAKDHAQEKFYLIACPEGSKIVRRSDQIALDGDLLPDLLVVPFEGKDIVIPVDPLELLPLLAESRRCALSLIGEPRADLHLEGASCPWSGEGDVNWLSVEDESQRVRCDRCRGDFDVNRGIIGIQPPSGLDSPRRRA
jgi:hypothetical protein